MKKTTRLRRAPFARVGRLIPRQFMTKPRTRTGPDAFTRSLVLQRDGGRCVICGGRGAEIHHRQPRGAGGSSSPAINSAANLLTLCRRCHREVESWRTVAEDYGYIVRRGITDPADVRVLIHGYGWALLSADGLRTRVAV